MHKEGVGKAGGMYVGGFCVRVGKERKFCEVFAKAKVKSLCSEVWAYARVKLSLPTLLQAKLHYPQENFTSGGNFACPGGANLVVTGGDMVDDAGEQTAQQPAGGIGHGDGNDLKAHLAHHEQVDLPEGYEGGKHNDHRRNGVSTTPQCTGIYLVKGK